MGEKSAIEKLRILLPHWIEHNNSHLAEFVRWRQSVAGEVPRAAAHLAEAGGALEKAGRSLEEALKELGGPLESHHHHHGHHHHDE